MTYVAVCPSIRTAHTRAMLATTDLAVDVYDNTRTNRGVHAAWNWGARLMFDRGADWLILLSASVRFGDPRGADFLAALDDPDAIAVEGAPHLGWHLLAFRAEVIDRVGMFDPNYWPGYGGDLDYARRVALCYELDPPFWRKVPVDATLTGYAEGVRHGNVKVDNVGIARYERAKHGGHPGDPAAVMLDTPFGLEGVPWSWFPPKGHRLASGLEP